MPSYRAWPPTPSPQPRLANAKLFLLVGHFAWLATSAGHGQFQLASGKHPLEFLRNFVPSKLADNRECYSAPVPIVPLEISTGSPRRP